jgi:hypothetical protein
MKKPMTLVTSKDRNVWICRRPRRLETLQGVTEYKRKRALREHFVVGVVMGMPLRHGRSGYHRINSKALLLSMIYFILILKLVQAPPSDFQLDLIRALSAAL